MVYVLVCIHLLLMCVPLHNLNLHLKSNTSEASDVVAIAAFETSNLCVRPSTKESTEKGVYTGKNSYGLQVESNAHVVN